MNRNEYSQACRYAFKLTGAKDIVHDAYVGHYKRTGEDLFSADHKTVIATIKNEFYKSTRRNRFMWRGTTYEKSYYSFNDHDVEQPLEEVFEFQPPTLVAELICKDQIEKIRGVLTPIQQGIFDQLVEGYLSEEIAEKRGVRANGIRITISRIRKKANWIRKNG